LLVSGALAAAMLVHGMFRAAFSADRQNIFELWGGGMLLVWGAVAASQAFTELHDKMRNDAFLLLPASALEKVASRLLLMVFGLAAYIIVFTNVVAWVDGLLALVLFGRNDQFYPLFDGSLGLLGLCLVQQSMYFLGAAWFRKNHFIKTALATTVIPIGLSVFAAFVVRIVFPHPFAAGFMDIDYGAFLSAYGPSLRFLLDVGGVFWFVVLPVLCWVVAWMRVKETQVSYGV
jgi:hypothetical protein